MGTQELGTHEVYFINKSPLEKLIFFYDFLKGCSFSLSTTFWNFLSSTSQKLSVKKDSNQKMR